MKTESLEKNDLEEKKQNPRILAAHSFHMHKPGSHNTLILNEHTYTHTCHKMPWQPVSSEVRNRAWGFDEQEEEFNNLIPFLQIKK